MSLARLGRLIGVIVLMVGGAHVSAAQDAPPPRILLDQSPRAVDYQLRRLSDDQLLRVERRDDDQRYRPVYMAILLRAGLPRADRAEALAALARLSRASPVAVLLEALGHVPLDDQRSAEGLVAMMAEQPIDRFRDDRQIAIDHLAQPDVPAPVMRGALAGLLAGGEPAASVWQLADARPGAVAALLQALSAFPPDRLDAMTPALGDRVEAVVRRTTADEPARVAAVQALARLRPHATTVSILAPLMAAGTAPDVQAAVIAALLTLSDAAWAGAPVDEVVTRVIAWLEAVPAADRTGVAATDAMALGERLAEALPADRARTLRAGLRALGVRVVRLETRPEQVVFDLRWFVVEANRPVQLVFVNPDAMPHNVVIGAPGSLERIGTAGGQMPLPSDPGIKPFVPDLPEVLHATRLITQGNSERLAFVAPEVPGEYVFVCTFPGHWVRMYGVMLVVPSLAAWEAAPTVPIDPMTKQPFASQRTE
ncbi:MAG: hypothetical protein ABS36_04430 [Acidobacteria bacterium SCN 69-37]|nr:MAG: hypothetical protein ABS36_04430 [Acidobacteria bacterium SCN 69-37]